MDDFLKLNAKEHKLYFKESTCAHLDVCQALCCRKWDINIAFEEYKEGVYKTEVICVLDKALCQHPKKPCPHRSYRLKKNKDGSCIYLNKENRCTIHTTRPIVCQNFFCDNGFTFTPLCVPHKDLDSDAEICSFEGGLPLQAKYLFNPYLELKHFLKTKNATILKFRDVTSCKDKIVTLMGMDFFTGKNNVYRFLNCFNGKKTLAEIFKKASPTYSNNDLQNLVLYLIDERVLIGVCN